MIEVTDANSITRAVERAGPVDALVGVRSYALDHTRAEQLWTRSEELVSAANALEPLA